jgi:hypothetical protein
VHYPFSELSGVSLKGKIKEENVLELLDVVLVQVVVAQVLSQSQHSLHLSQGIMILVIVLDILHQLVSVTSAMASCFSNQQIEVIR